MRFMFWLCALSMPPLLCLPLSVVPRGSVIRRWFLWFVVVVFIIIDCDALAPLNDVRSSMLDPLILIHVCWLGVFIAGFFTFADFAIRIPLRLLCFSQIVCLEFLSLPRIKNPPQIFSTSCRIFSSIFSFLLVMCTLLQILSAPPVLQCSDLSHELFFSGFERAAQTDDGYNNPQTSHSSGSCSLLAHTPTPSWTFGLGCLFQVSHNPNIVAFFCSSFPVSNHFISSSKLKSSILKQLILDLVTLVIWLWIFPLLPLLLLRWFRPLLICLHLQRLTPKR